MTSEHLATSAPAIVRLAGLPGHVMDAVASPSTVAASEAWAAANLDLEEAQKTAVDLLYPEIKKAKPDERRLLLRAKRDCFNGRRIIDRWCSETANLVDRVVPGLVAELQKLEARAVEAEKAFERTFETEKERIWQDLLSWTEDPGFARGLSAGSPSLKRNLDRVHRGETLPARKLVRAQQVLLRYASRASLKLSPFSTLTYVGLGSITNEVAPDDPVILTKSSHSQAELRRLSRLTLNRLYALLCLHPPFRSRLRVSLNDSLCSVSEANDGRRRFRVVRPSHLAVVRDAEEIRFFDEVIITLPIEPKLMEALRRILGDRIRLGELGSRLSRAVDGEPTEIDAEIDRLLRAGVLWLDPPWTAMDMRPEAELMGFLQQIAPKDKVIEEAARMLAGVVRMLEGSPRNFDPARPGPKLATWVSQSFKVIQKELSLHGLEMGAPATQVHEDIFVASDRSGGEVARISETSARRALESIRPLMIYSDLNYTRYELLLSFRALAAQRWPQQCRIPFLEFLPAAMSVWRSYSKSSKKKQAEPWNPFDLDEIRSLAPIREQATRRLSEALRRGDGEYFYDLEAASAAIEAIPEVYRPSFGPCLFMQPAESGEDLWVLNHLLDGTGRFSTRYTLVMPPQQAARYAKHFERRSISQLLGEPAELVDIVCSRSDHLNVHRRQTHRVLVLPGEPSDLPRNQRVSLSQLWLSFDGPLPYLTDDQNQRVLPTFLGATSLFPMPTLVKLISHISFGEVRPAFLNRPFEEVNGCKIYERIRIGNVIPHRRQWSFSPQEAFGDLSALSDLELYRAVNHWREQVDMPEKVFVSERLTTRFNHWDVHKPQYIDFSSPAFVPIFRDCLASSPEKLRAEEVLPEPGAFPMASDGTRRAFEIQLEDIALRESHTRAERLLVEALS